VSSLPSPAERIEREVPSAEVLEAAPDAMLVVDVAGTIIYVNGEAENLFGYARDELLGRSIEVLMPEARRASHAEKRRAYAAAPEPRPMGVALNIEGRRKDGAVFPADVKLSPLRTASGLMVTAAIRDITERKRAEEQLVTYARHLEELKACVERKNLELEQKNAELVRLNEEKNSFVGMAAHDLRNPLCVILGYSDFLLIMRSSELAEEDAEIIEQIRSSSHFMLSLINDLLNISTIESGKLTLDRTLVDLGELTVANVRCNTVLAARKGMRLMCEVDRDLPRVLVDAHRVEQVLSNLISNAVQYSFPETSIEIAVRQQPGEVVISVTDHGQGIAPRDVGKLFKPFGRATSVSTGGETSTGLGLAIARRIVEGHGGRIWVESELGKGSTFFVAFPVEAASASPAAAGIS
jgi:PAS domain S-box-containing protein